MSRRLILDEVSADQVDPYADQLVQKDGEWLVAYQDEEGHWTYAEEDVDAERWFPEIIMQHPKKGRLLPTLEEGESYETMVNIPIDISPEVAEALVGCAMDVLPNEVLLKAAAEYALTEIVKNNEDNHGSIPSKVGGVQGELQQDEPTE